MGIINIVKNVKEIHKDYVVLVRTGTFYNCYGRDSYVISYLLGYKIKIIENKIYNCSFSKAGYNKVISSLEKYKINYIVLDKRNNYDVDDKNNFGNLNRYGEIYKLARNEISLKLRVAKICNYLISNNDEQTIFEVERLINERRKV